jgi:hypothetical protein
MRRFVVGLLGSWLLLIVNADAQNLANISPAYVPEANYKHLKCEALLHERARAESDLVNMTAQLQNFRSKYFIDVLALGLPLTTADGNSILAETRLEHGISHVKGQIDAIYAVLNRKRCEM